MAQNNYSMFSPQAQALFNNPDVRGSLQSGQNVYYNGSPSNFQTQTFTLPPGSTGRGVLGSNQAVLGSTSQQSNTPPTNLGGYKGSGMDQGAYDLAQARANQPSDPYASLKSDISSSWDQYINSLGDVGNTYLPQQQTAQQNIADSQLQQGQNTINTQKAASLRDIGSNIKNAFQAGNVFLGTRGAGDSSAGNQYQFAVGQEANKQTGQLNEFVNTQLNNLQSTHDQQIQGIAQWFAEQQQSIKQAVASGQLQKSQDINNLSRSILDQAIAATNTLKQNSQNQYNALLQWAANNSTNMGQLQSNIAAIPQAFGQPQVDSTGNFRLPPTGSGAFGGNVQQKKDLFGNPIS